MLFTLVALRKQSDDEIQGTTVMFTPRQDNVVSFVVLRLIIIGQKPFALGNTHSPWAAKSILALGIKNNQANYLPKANALCPLYKAHIRVAHELDPKS